MCLLLRIGLILFSTKKKDNILILRMKVLRINTVRSDVNIMFETLKELSIKVKMIFRALEELSIKVKNHFQGTGRNVT